MSPHLFISYISSMAIVRKTGYEIDPRIPLLTANPNISYYVHTHHEYHTSPICTHQYIFTMTYYADYIL